MHSSISSFSLISSISSLLSAAFSSIYMRRVLLSVACLSVLTLAACNVSEPLPVGEQTVKGTLTRVGISLTRRGTHLLQVDPKHAYYVESTTVALLPYEKRSVTLKGTFEVNVYPQDLPVLVVTEIVGGEAEKLRAWAMPAFGITMDLPRSWDGDVTSSLAQFLMSGSELPALRIAREETKNLPFDFVSMTASGSSMTLMPLTINTRKAVMISYADQPLVIFTVALDGLANAGKVLAFSFRLPIDASATDEMRSAESDRVLSYMRTLRFSISSSSRSTVKPSTGTGASAAGKPCGGPAGILCPIGYFCQVTDTATDIGKCKQM